MCLQEKDDYSSSEDSEGVNADRYWGNFKFFLHFSLALCIVWQLSLPGEVITSIFLYPGHQFSMAHQTEDALLVLTQSGTRCLLTL